MPGAVAARLPLPALLSQALWSNFMQFVTGECVVIEPDPDPADSRPKPPRADWVVRPTSADQRAQQVWRPLAGVIERRWQARFGAGDVERLRESLEALLGQCEGDQTTGPGPPECPAALSDGVVPRRVSRRRLTGQAAHQVLDGLSGSGVML